MNNKITYSDHDGKSFETAIIISGAKTAPVGINAEYDYVASKLGVESIDWELVQQSLYHTDDGDFDVHEVKTKEGEVITYHFNITEFFERAQP
jgi:hypothetical protein